MDEAGFPIDRVAPEPIVCPNCGESLTVERSEEIQRVQCPFCQTEFSLGIPDENEEFTIDSVVNTEREDELDGLRIRQMVQLRRSAIRARTYAVIIMFCCLVMGVQLVFTDMQEVHVYGWDRWAILYAICAGAMAIGATISSRKANVLHRESRTPASPTAEQTPAPQFDQLSDGSHHVKNLEEMQERNAE